MGIKTRVAAVAVFFVALYFAGRMLAANTKMPVKRDVNVSVVPRHIDGWEGRDCPVNQKLLEDRENVIERVYTGPNGLIARLIVVYSRNWRSIHPPEMCTTAVGWRMFREYTVDISLPGGLSGPARALVMHRKGDTMGGVYLYADASTITDSWTNLFGQMVAAPQKLSCLLAVYVLDPKKKTPGEELVKTARQLCEKLLPYVQKSLKSKKGGQLKPKTFQEPEKSEISTAKTLRLSSSYVLPVECGKITQNGISFIPHSYSHRCI